ncbi:hypothetical protein FVF72_00625 [Methanothermobacter sp. KEPCO-1]|uniref:hypothetical protein n=1 Tax=Methanothermobacter sp. KEPCO-1 TaxID=2603820 RepID=UPI0011CCC691|nr:hypothetical protein [Methanothermobacter sp. KEPCO-1]QEF93792.1 hypothetical protein FVF72_00625 [Methanothermobacter sp. KEPCO-1]
MKLINIVSCLEDGNVIECGGNALEAYQGILEAIEAGEITPEATLVYLVTPMPLKAGLLQILRAHKPGASEKLTITGIMNEIASVKGETWVFMDHFEDLTEKAALKYLWLHENGNVNYMAAINGTMRAEVGSFYSTFQRLNPHECLDDEAIDVTWAFMAFMSILMALAYFKVGLDYGILITGALWFALIAFRTMNYILR